MPNDEILYFDAPDFSLKETLECGQFFRYNIIKPNTYAVAALGHRFTVAQQGTQLLVSDAPRNPNFRAQFVHLFSLDTDYASIKTELCRDITLQKAVAFAPGIRVMNQPLWEATCCFIISQNNNIKRIAGIIERLCESFGGNGGAAFPSPEQLTGICCEDLAPLRSGFRAKYILDAAKKFAAGQIDEMFVKAAPLGEARAVLTQINGVGPKVADCALLFGAGRIEAFPRDVWINRAMAHLFPNGLPPCAVPYAGIAQQYIFHYARTAGIFEN